MVDVRRRVHRRFGGNNPKVVIKNINSTSKKVDGRRI